MVKKIMYLIGAIILLCMIGNVIVKSAETNTVEIPEGYTQITDIEGVSFYIDDRLLDMATAITQISEEAGLDSSTYYVYKDGSSKYILFNLNKMVIIAQKGTNFHFAEADDYETALESSNICNIWFSKTGKELDITSEGNRFFAKVNAAITITRTLYDDFTGELVTFNENGEEWGIFVGVPGTDYSMVSSNDKEIIETIAESLYITTETNSIEDTTLNNTEFNVEEDTSETKSIVDEITETQEMSSSEIEIVDSTLELEIETSETESSEDTISVSISGENGVIEQKEQSIIQDTVEIEENQTSEMIYVEEGILTPEKEPDEQVSTDIKESSDTNIIDASSNQREKRSNESVYVSDIYTMLDIGDQALITAYDYQNKELAEPVINITNIYRDNDAIALLKEKLGKDYCEPKDGCTWHAITYDLNLYNCKGEPYVNIKLRGLDGTELKYRGIKYSKKTHDITETVHIDGNWSREYICYYEIPNGCIEYVLECGEGTIDTNKEIKAAYYLIKGEN